MLAVSRQWVTAENVLGSREGSSFLLLVEGCEGFYRPVSMYTPRQVAYVKDGANEKSELKGRVSSTLKISSILAMVSDKANLPAIS